VLTPYEGRQVVRVQAALMQAIARAGVKIERLDNPRVHAVYRPLTKTIMLTSTPYPPWGPPPAVERLFTLAHEFGHFKSHVRHAKVGRRVDLGSVPHQLFEESRAWNEAGYLLRYYRLRGARLWHWFAQAVGMALWLSVSDYTDYFWLTDKLRRQRVRCPRCRSRALVVRSSCAEHALLCRACKAHTPSTRSVEKLAARIRGSRFGGLCRCRRGCTP